MHRLAALLLAAGLALSFVQFQDSFRTAPIPLVPVIAYAHDHGHGSAVSLGGGMLLTAKHVTDGGEGLQVLFGDEIYSGKLEKHWPDRDLALMSSELQLRPTPIRCEELPIGERVTATGFPMDLGYMRVQGYVGGPIKWDRHLRIDNGLDFTGRPPKPKQFRALQALDLRVAPGMSGGPVTDSANRLVGITIITIDDFAALMVPGPAICEALAQKE